MKFIWEMGGQRLVLAGAIDETFLIPVSPAYGSGLASIDFKAVTSINSLGVQRFLDFLGNFSSRRLVYENCGTAPLIGFNCLPALLGVNGPTAFVKSFSTLFECSACGTEVHCVIDAKEVTTPSKQFVAPQRICLRCSKPMEADAYDIQALADLGELGVFNR